jgi:hypothetical protein
MDESQCFPTIRMRTATKLLELNCQCATLRTQEEFMADDMEKKGQQGGQQSNQQGGQPGQQDQQRNQTGQTGQQGNQSGQKKGGETEDDNENLDQQRRAS